MENSKKVIIISEIEGLIKQAQYFEAHNKALNYITEFPDDLRLKQLYALSLARLGATERALEFLEKIYNKGHLDTETLGILGRTYKDLWIKTREAKYAKLSRNIYLSSFQKEGSYYTGINAATMSFFVNDKEKGVELANNVVSIIQAKGANDYWALATLGEAFLLIGDTKSALEYYNRAVLLADNNYGDISSTFRQLKLIASTLKLNLPQAFSEILKPPVILAFSGHMIDRPDREQPRFPASIENQVTEQIKKAIEELNPKIVYSSVACGSDIIFLELMQERNAEINIYLPFLKEDFLQTSISFAGEAWVDRFQKILASYSVKYATEESYLGDNDLFAYTGNLIMGLSMLRAKLMDTTPMFLSVIDLADTARHKAGTLDLLEKWSYKENIHIIDISKIEKPAKPQLNSLPVIPSTIVESKVPFGVKREIKCILFADIVGFSKMNEAQTPYFMFELLGIISNNIKKLQKQPETINTWGDAIFATYETAEDMMQFASVVNDIILNTKWSERNLPDSTNIRIALHVGPVFKGIDPITDKGNAYGTHINRTARMEPVTLPGCIYASEQFASTLIVETGDKYKYEYVGIIELPKKFGKQEIYSVSKY
jgi:class 3 adenylate cyclase/tetratricopeptide (TPR) repeat protein